jgi:hypothetical protein
VRFEVSRVLDTIEQRLTTDVTLAQAVVDLSDVAGYVQLDGGRTVSLLRVGMVLDALARYLLDGAAMLYPVAGRDLLAEQALTAKERMVLGRWVEDGRIEAVPVVDDRVLEIADFTGVPVVACRDYRRFAPQYRWLNDSPERVLRLVPRRGKAVLVRMGHAAATAAGNAERTVAVAKPVVPRQTDGAQALPGAPPEAAKHPAERPRPTADLPEPDVTDQPVPDAAAAPEPDADPGVFTPRAWPAQTRVSTRAIEPPAEPSSLGAALLARCWRCPEPNCPSFGEYRRPGQPVPRMDHGVPVCPRHDEPLSDLGPRPPEYPVAVVVDDMTRRRFPVSASGPVQVGREPDDPDGIAVGRWLHEAAARWIAKTHLRLEIRDRRLMVTDLGENGTVVWRRAAPDDPGEPVRLYENQSCVLAEWDSVELYTGVELLPGNRRLVGGPVAAPEVRSVLVDAPTVAFRLPRRA